MDQCHSCVLQLSYVCKEKGKYILEVCEVGPTQKTGREEKPQA